MMGMMGMMKSHETGSKSTSEVSLTMPEIKFWDSPDTNCCVEMGDLQGAICGNQPDQRRIEVQITTKSPLIHH